MTWVTYSVKVPGRFADRTAYLDIETRKVPASYVMENGEPLRKRWEAFLIGFALNGEVTLVSTEGGTYESLLDSAAYRLLPAREIVYGATRDFDEMVLRGRFTNARRAHAPRRFYPALPGTKERELWLWTNVGTAKSDAERGPDIPSAEIASRSDADWPTILVHNLRDVADLILVAGSPDAECEAWCRRVLDDFDFALDLVLAARAS